MAVAFCSIDINRIEVSAQIKKNYYRLSDSTFKMRYEKELKIPILVACDVCFREKCPCFSDGIKICSKNSFINGLCKQTPTLLVGATRLETAKRLGWKEINCYIIEKKNYSATQEIETITNRMRTSFSLWEKVEAGLKLERGEKILAQLRSKAGTSIIGQKHGRVRDLVAKKAGFESANSYLSAKNIYLNAHPRIRDLVANDFLKPTPASRIAQLPEYKQLQVAFLFETLFKSGTKNQKLISFIVNKVLPGDSNFLDKLIDKNKPQDFSKNNVNKLIKSWELRDKNKSRKKDNIYITASYRTNPETEKDNLVTQASTIRDNIADILLSVSEIKDLDKPQTEQLDKTLLHIEKITRNCREHLRIQSKFFKNDFNNSATKHRSALIENIQFFGNSFLRNLEKIDSELLDDLARVFRNATTILDNVTISLARHIQK